LKNSLRKSFFREPWFERFFVEPEMVLLWRHSKEPFSVPDGTFMFLCAGVDVCQWTDVVMAIAARCSQWSFTGGELRSKWRPGSKMAAVPVVAEQ